MKERIRQLAIQAGVYVGDDMWFADELNPKTQMFAQLLIEECIRVGSAAELEGRVWWTEAIRIHFGGAEWCRMRKFSDVLEEYLHERERLNIGDLIYDEARYRDRMYHMQDLAKELDEMVQGVNT
jgi:hypothetical protein